MTRPVLFIFAKAPVMGRAKTRLAADIGPVHAQRLYRAMSQTIFRNVQHHKWDTILAITPAKWLMQVPDWEGLVQIPQVSGSLTPRLEAVFNRKGPTIVIGTDCPQVTANDIDIAFKALRRDEIVLGPADDGGFWLLGVNAPLSSPIFEDVRWSTEHALADVVANCQGSVHYLRTLTDVDDAKALRRIRAR